MKKAMAAIGMIGALLAALFCMPFTAAASYSLPDTVTLHASSALLVYLGTEQHHDAVIYEKNADESTAPAGLVRIAVGLYALRQIEEKNLDPATATGTYSHDIESVTDRVGLSTVDMKVGDVWTLDDLLAVSMLQTASDAVGTLVAALSGTEEAFVAGMNAMAAEIGCTHTQFRNVYGLDDPEQYTTARDMYRLLRHASLNYPKLTVLLGYDEYTVHPIKGEQDYWPTTNQMLRESSEYYYTPLLYGRSGYTESVGHSCASVVRDEGQEAMVVLLGCKDAPPAKSTTTTTRPSGDGSDEGEDDEDESDEEDDWEEDEYPAFTDTMTLARWMYNAFTFTAIVSKGQPITRVPVSLSWTSDSVVLVAGESLSGMLRNGVELSQLRYDIQLKDDDLIAPVDKGQVCGTARIYDGDELVGTFDLLAAETVSRSQLLALFENVWKVVASPVMLIVLGVLGVLLIVYLVIGTAHNQKRRRKKQRRVKRYK
ncbi:MAG: D-alanyl-D-alanine carboxypeptidase [Clostridia bacterium]|nr:D-alanyl-D-alanine carboxypeptidase [Clostridia bacterium]